MNDLHFQELVTHGIYVEEERNHLRDEIPGLSFPLITVNTRWKLGTFDKTRRVLASCRQRYWLSQQH